MDKEEKEYHDKYQTVPRDFLDRLSYLLSELKIKKHASQIFDRAESISNIKWNNFSLCIFLEPKATPRPRSGFGGKVFYVKGAALNRKRFKKFMDSIEQPMITTPMKFKCTTYFPIPSSMNKVEKILAELGYIRPISKPDWDNVGKTYSDMVQEQLVLDDSLIIEGKVSKFYSAKPRVEISIEYMDEHDSKFNESKIRKIIERREEKYAK